MKARVLIVDDEPDFLNLVAFNLDAHGFEVITAATGLEGLRRARCDAPQIVLLDLMLPDVDGLSVCQMLCSQPGMRGVPIIILSALDAPLKRARGDKAKVFRWLKMGVGFDVLVESIRNALAADSTIQSPATAPG